MSYLKLIPLFLISLALMQCSKEDQIRVETTTVTDNDNVSFLIHVVNENGESLSGATLTNKLSGSTSVSDERGLALLENLSFPASGLPITIELDGWMKQVKILNGRSNSRTTLELEMYKFDRTSSIPTGSIGSISSGGFITLPSTLLRPDNSTYTGNVTVKTHYLNPTDTDFLADAPGNMSGIGADGQLYTLQSFGMYAIELYDELGNELKIPEGATAEVRFPLPDNYEAAPEEVPLWSMDEETGRWIEEGFATRAGTFLVAEVSHFSWWNCDVPLQLENVCMSLVDELGTPLSNYDYLVTSADGSVYYFMGTADSEGNVCTNVPRGFPVAISVYLGNNLSPGTEIGSFEETVDIGQVSIDITVFQVTGTVLDCEGAAQSNALVRYRLNGNEKFTLSDGEGIFNITLYDGGGLVLQVFDYDELTKSEEINALIEAPQQHYDLGSISLCEAIDPGDCVYVANNITTNTTWASGRCYVLTGRITVLPDVTLTIEPGVVVKGELGTGVNATLIMVARGGKIMAEGTAELPIIFTSRADEITPEDVAAGNIQSPNLGPDVNGYWGGLVILGNAPISASNDNGDIQEVAIEGIPTSDPYVLYGGTDPADNSGVLRYVSIRHSGANIGNGNEINALTLGGVGNGTTIDHIEVVGTKDDGIEYFGGTVNTSNMVIWNTGDDGIDTDQAWAGTLDNFILITPTGSCFELDGPEGTYTARHTIQNGTVVAIRDGRRITNHLIDLDSGTPADLKNIHFVDPLSYLDENDVTTYLTMTEDEIDNTTFENVTFNVSPAELVNLMEQGGAIPPGVSSGGSPQADASVLFWTWAAQAGQLDGL